MTPLRYLHIETRYSAGRKANVPGKFAGKCGARIVLGKAEVHTYYDVSYSFKCVHALGNWICHLEYSKYI